MIDESVPCEQEAPSKQSTTSGSTLEISRNTLDTLAKTVPSHAAHISMALVFLTLVTAPVGAQSDLGSVWCGTGVDTGANIIIGGLAGLVLPATMLFMIRAGLSYERAGGNPEKKNEAKNQLVMSAVGFIIVALAVLSPAIIDNIGSQMGFGFADCMYPF